ncbi:hypothetical protein D9Q98_002319 [Chlorella vulgaris]|uniref:Dynein assembly factor 1, axonemal homolog n=1 Tax=Chlorella vulgaris TaxID=3077 RepID=A0A9D4TWF9_CHLVU|nr:hypothetical protein D9Q98_002319 [Chlorella vulgaris]
MEMDEAALRAVCKEHRHFSTPHLNDTLYCNFKGFTSLAGLEPYTGLRALFLEGNALESTAGLPTLPRLRCLFLQQNMLCELAPGSLASQPDLHMLNIAGNQLMQLKGLEGCTTLQSLNASGNRLSTAAALEPLAAGCPALGSLDLQNNLLKDGPAVLAIVSRLPALKCLYLKGNPLVSSMSSYRKATIAAIPSLTYLDDRPVFEVERTSAEAWAQGGVDAERAARAAYYEQERAREKRRVAALRELREAGWKLQREARSLSGSGDPALDGLPEDFEATEQEDEEPESLREARQRLAAFTASRAPQDNQLQGCEESDVLAVLEESRANQAELHRSALCSSLGTAPSQAAAKESSSTWDNSSGALPAASAAATVPEAKLTVEVHRSCAAGQEVQGAEGTAPPSGECIARGIPGNRTSALGPWHEAELEPATDSDDEGSASVEEEDSEGACLDALD